MTVRLERRYGRIVADIRTQGPDGRWIRKRACVPSSITSESLARRWALNREKFLTANGDAQPAKEIPTLRDFGPKWLEEYAVANGNKPSTVAAKETILRLHLYPVLGTTRLDAIRDHEIQRLKFALKDLAPKTRACILSVLATLLKTAGKWGRIDKVPVIDAPKWTQPQMEFYGFEEWGRLIDGAKRAGPMVLAAVLLGGDAGLRRGEIVALEGADIGKGLLHVVRNDWQGEVGTPKGGKGRRVPLTSRLAQAIEEIRHLRGKRLLWQADGNPVGVPTLQSWLEVACKRAGLPPSRNLHKLRHTFCSHLAMGGVPVTTIKEWAGHASLATTMRYMHLSPSATDAMIGVLETPGSLIVGGVSRERSDRKR